MSIFWSQALCTSARMQVTQTVRTQETEKEGGEGERANVNLPPSPERGVHQLNSATICQQVASASPTLAPTPCPGQGHPCTRSTRLTLA